MMKRVAFPLMVAMAWAWWAMAFAPPAQAMLVINEFLADPPADLAGDANGDGSRSSVADEFVELYNISITPLDLSGWTLEDESQPRHEFDPGTELLPSEMMVVFGGGAPTGIESAWVTASTGSLSLNNGGDTLIVRNSAGDVVAEYTYGTEAGNDEALTRYPDGTGAFVLHSETPGGGGRLFSPGTLTDGTAAVAQGTGTEDPLPAQDTAAVPEPSLLPLWAFALARMMRK